ncbi:MAG: aldolase [Methanomicrobiales archaeon]|nr:aldolase [Methanomicrobiales archaeon]
MRDSEAERIGRRLHKEGLASGNFGNLSVRDEAGFYIKRRNAYLDMPGALVFVPQNGPVPVDASRESIVHREIYQNTSAKAIVHAHPSYAIALSYFCDEITPYDYEGEMLCPRVRVVEGASGTRDLARTVASALRSSPVVIVRGHGTFAIGATLDEAYVITSTVEHACRILFLRSQVKIEGFPTRDSAGFPRD